MNSRIVQGNGYFHLNSYFQQMLKVLNLVKIFLDVFTVSLYSLFSANAERLTLNERI